jgi:hypothetical protein
MFKLAIAMQLGVVIMAAPFLSGGIKDYPSNIPISFLPKGTYRISLTPQANCGWLCVQFSVDSDVVVNGMIEDVKICPIYNSTLEWDGYTTKATICQK